MLLNSNKTIILDCDGVIFDSNYLKLDAMKNALHLITKDKELIDKCIKYFSENFGKSRFHHVEFFIKNFIKFESKTEEYNAYNSVINCYSESCRTLYLNADFCKDVELVFTKSNGNLFVASGSDEDELNFVFHKRNIKRYFSGVFGSPKKKDEIIKQIINDNNFNKADCIFIGDSLADYHAALKNDVEFIFYYPYSNVKKDLETTASENGIEIIYDWSDLEVC